MSFFGARLTPQNGQPVPNAEPVVLKDSWSAHDQNREDEILVQIFDDLRQKNGLKKETEAGKYFLTVLAAGNVIVDRKVDNTESFLRYPDRLPAGYGLHSLRVDESPKPTWTGEGIIPNFSCVSPSATQSKTHHRTHYRLVFKEVCQPIYELRRLDIVFKTLMDVHKGLLSCSVLCSWWLIRNAALEFLHSVDWVHRDISSGNVLRWGEMGKLADLEYAKRMDSNTAHEVRTGTLDFMACEVEAQRYLFEEHIGVLFVPVDCPFRFNSLHDMESLWWIATWILYYHVDREGSRPSSEQIMQLHKLFPERLESALFSTFSAALKYRVLPASFQSAGLVVEFMRQEIKTAYAESEKTLPPVYSNPLKRLHSAFTDHLTSTVAHSTDIRIFSPNAKRQQEDPTPDTQDTKQPKRDDSHEHSNAGHQYSITSRPWHHLNCA